MGTQLPQFSSLQLKYATMEPFLLICRCKLCTVFACAIWTCKYIYKHIFWAHLFGWSCEGVLGWSESGPCGLECYYPLFSFSHLYGAADGKVQSATLETKKYLWYSWKRFCHWAWVPRWRQAIEAVHFLSIFLQVLERGLKFIQMFSKLLGERGKSSEVRPLMKEVWCVFPVL